MSYKLKIFWCAHILCNIILDFQHVIMKKGQVEYDKPQFKYSRVTRITCCKSHTSGQILLLIKLLIVCYDSRGNMVHFTMRVLPKTK